MQKREDYTDLTTGQKLTYYVSDHEFNKVVCKVRHVVLAAKGSTVADIWNDMSIRVMRQFIFGAPKQPRNIHIIDDLVSIAEVLLPEKFLLPIPKEREAQMAQAFVAQARRVFESMIDVLGLGFLWRRVTVNQQPGALLSLKYSARDKDGEICLSPRGSILYPRWDNYTFTPTSTVWRSDPYKKYVIVLDLPGMAEDEVRVFFAKFGGPGLRLVVQGSKKITSGYFP